MYTSAPAKLHLSTVGQDNFVLSDHTGLVGEHSSRGQRRPESTGNDGNGMLFIQVHLPQNAIKDAYVYMR